MKKKSKAFGPRGIQRRPRVTVIECGTWIGADYTQKRKEPRRRTSCAGELNCDTGGPRPQRRKEGAWEVGGRGQNRCALQRRIKLCASHTESTVPNPKGLKSRSSKYNYKAKGKKLPENPFDLDLGKNF